MMRLLNLKIKSSKLPHLDRLRKEEVSIFIMWLFTLSALIGISLGYFDWFIPKTPLNLTLAFVLVLLNFKRDTNFYIAFIFSALIGFGIEVVGVSSGQIFGDYYYGNNLGSKLFEVPILIGVFWAVLALVTSQISQLFKLTLLPTVTLGASLMVILDYIMEQLAHSLDFWHFNGGYALLQNYIAWFVIAFFLQLIMYSRVEKQATSFSVHLYANQFTFFLTLYIMDLIGAV